MVHYRTTCSYSDDDAKAKQAFVRAAGRGHQPTVLDLGANDGELALAAEQAATWSPSTATRRSSTCSIGGYGRGCRENVLPLVMNLVDPSGGIGWRNRERAPFVERVRPDATLALALVHHLAIAANVPLPEVVAWLAAFGGRLVVEFPTSTTFRCSACWPTSRRVLFDDYRRGAFEGCSPSSSWSTARRPSRRDPHDVHGGSEALSSQPGWRAEGRRPAA